MSYMRPREVYGDVELSVQASSVHLCEPTVDNLPIEAYQKLDVGVYYKGRLCRPSEIGVNGFDHLFTGVHYPTAPYLPKEVLFDLSLALTLRAQ